MAGTAGTPSQAWYTNANLPVELRTWVPLPTGTDVLDGAQLTYFSAFNPALTTLQYAYLGEALIHKSTGVNTGFYKIRFVGAVANASVSTTPVPKMLGAQPADFPDLTPGYPQVTVATYETMPAELAAFIGLSGITPGQTPSIAQLVYTSNWNPTATTPQIAYYFTCWMQSTTSPFAILRYSGVGWVANASVSTTPVPRLWDVFSSSGTTASNGGSQGYEVISHQDVTCAFIGEDVNGNGGISVYDSEGGPTVQLDSNVQLDGLGKTTGGQVRIFTSLGAGNVTPLGVFPNVTVSASAQ